MADTKIKAGQFYGVIGHGTDGYFLMTNADGSMSWSQASTGPSVTSVAYPGDDTAADPAGGQTVVLTGTGFATSGMTVSIGGTTAPSVAHDSNTQLTITTPAKAAGDYDIVVTNTVTGASGTFVNGISYNGIPTWTTAAGSLGTFESETTISTITLQATEPDGGTITFNITNGALPSGLSLTGANIDGTTTAESSTTLYSFTIEAIDDENQSTPRNFSITVNSAEITPSENFTINTYTGTGSTQSIEGKIGTAADFNGNNSKIDVGNQTWFDSDFTLSMWFYPQNTSGTDFETLVYKRGSSDFTNPFGLGVYEPSHSTLPQKIAFILGGGGSTATVVSATNNYNINEWNHVLVKVSGTAMSITLNGTETTGTFSGTRQTNTETIRFGNKYTIDNDYPFDGKIDQVRIFNKALSSSEISTLAAESNSSSTKSTTDIFDDGSGVALYEFEEEAKDTGGVTGYIGSGGIFNGSSSYINVPITQPNDISISVWINISDATRQHQIVSHDLGGASADRNLQFRVELDQTVSAYWFSGTKAQTTSSVSLNTWTHIVATWEDNGSQKIYFNGVLEDTQTSTTRPPFSKLFIGVRNSTTFTDATKGKIDQVRIFNKVLSSSEVTTLYGETSASATKSTTDIFDDGSGIALYELEGNANDTGDIGYIDGAAKFNGTNSYIDLSIPNATQATIDSIFTWVKFNSVGTNQAITNLGDSTSDNGSLKLRLDGSTNTIRLIAINTSKSSESIYSTTVITTDTWYNVGAVWTGSSWKLYINGTNEATTSSTTSRVASVGDTVYLGQIYRSGFTNQQPLDGFIDEVRFYTDEITDAEAGYIANNTTASIPTTNLLSYYKLDSDATDEQGNYNGDDYKAFYNGTATNVSYAYNGTPTNVGFIGTSFEPGMIWIKERTSTSAHRIVDSVRGDGNRIFPNSTNAEAYTANGEVFQTNGFSIGADNGSNENGQDYVAWYWKAGGTAVSNTDGTITSSVSANQEAGFSIVKWTGGSASGLSVGHGLGVSPSFIILKPTDRTAAWYIYHKDLASNQSLRFDNTAANTSLSFPNVNSLNFNSDWTNSTWDFIAYCFADVDGYQKVGSYSGTSTTNPITTGFLPRFVLIKKYTEADDWIIYDSIRGEDLKLRANQANAEDSTRDDLDFTSTGFTLKGSYGLTNASGQSYIYLAIA